MVIRHRNGCTRKRIRFRDISPSGKVLRMNFFNDIRTRDRQQIIVPLYFMWEIFETRAAVIGIRQFIFLNQRTHRTVQDQNPVAQLFINRWLLHNPAKIPKSGETRQELGA